MTRDWYKTIIVKKQGITNRKINIVLTYTGTQDVLYILQLPLNAQVSFTFHFSLFINTSIHYFKGSLSARFRFALLLIFASASVFSSSPCTPDRAITTCDMGWTFLSPDSTGFVTGVLVEGGWEQPALLRFLANPEKIISENYCVLKGFITSTMTPALPSSPAQS